MDLKIVLIISMVLFRIYGINQGIYKLLKVPSDIWTPMVYKMKILNSTLKRPSYSEIAAYCLIESNCEAFVINGDEILFIDSTVNQEFLQGGNSNQNIPKIKSYLLYIVILIHDCKTFFHYRKR